MKNSVLCYLEETVERFPEKIALTDQEGDVSFSEWKSRALHIADKLVEKGVFAKKPVLVYLPKSAMTLVSFAGVLYSGNYYTPTDVRFPFEKVNSILNCLHPEIIITDHKSAQLLLENGLDDDTMLYVDDIDFSEKKTDSEFYLSRIIDTDLAYVFFTSGSTGVPKGVSITQRSIIDYIDWAADEFDINENERIANQAPFYFDNSILDIYLCMSRGAHLFIPPEMFFSFTTKILEYIRDNEINFIFWVPSALIGVANSGLLDRIDCTCIKKVLFCGEVMPNRHLNIWRKALPNVVYANLYGPTEITDVCAYYVIDREFDDDEPLPIGRACRNTEIMLLNDDDQLITEKEVKGELCVRGTCNAVGYYDNPEKTSEAFVQNPLQSFYREYIYRTGDLAHYNERGEIMFDGRKDFQIKYMGYRIELGEIETALLSHPKVDNACCIFDSESQKIVAFCSSKTELDEVGVKKHLMELLPKYMIPKEYFILEELPYNDNGKINRKVLKQEYIDK